jgi:hypothetical protein
MWCLNFLCILWMVVDSCVFWASPRWRVLHPGLCGNNVLWRVITWSVNGVSNLCSVCQWVRTWDVAICIVGMRASFLCGCCMLWLGFQVWNVILHSLVGRYQTTWLQIPEDNTHRHCYENLKYPNPSSCPLCSNH